MSDAHPLSTVPIASSSVEICGFGRFAELFGQRFEVEMATPCTIAALFELLATLKSEAAPALSDRRVRACIDQLIVPSDHLVQARDRVELLAPVSGG